jgi:hypothetical protein
MLMKSGDVFNIIGSPMFVTESYDVIYGVAGLVEKMNSDI